MESYQDFENEVRCLCDKKDFKVNEDMVKRIYIRNYNLFITALKLGSEIQPAMKIVQGLNMIVKETCITEEDAIDLIGKYRLIDAYFNFKDTYK